MSDAGPLDAIVVTRIAELRERAGLTVDQLAESSLLTRDQLDRILDGNEALTVDLIILLAGALGVEPAWLIRGIDQTDEGDG